MRLMVAAAGLILFAILLTHLQRDTPPLSAKKTDNVSFPNDVAANGTVGADQLTPDSSPQISLAVTDDSSLESDVDLNFSDVDPAAETVTEGRLDATVLRDHLDESTSDWIADRFSFALQEVLHMENEADLYGSMSVEALTEYSRAVFQRVREDLGDESYAAGLFALGMTNRLTLAAPKLEYLESGDVLLQVNGQRVFNAAEVANWFNSAKSGGAVEILVFRAGRRESLAVTSLDELGDMIEESVSPSDYFALE